MKFGTKAVHAGVEPDPTTGAIMTPIYQTSTYVQAAPGEHKGYEYSRTQNPTRDALQKSLAQLEGGNYGICFSSGLAAIDAVIKLFDPGDEVVASNNLYGGAYRLFTKVFAKFNIKFKFISMENAEEVEQHITENTKLIWLETPTNPMLNIIDIKAVSRIAKKHNILLGIDNTFATPYLQQPFEIGADIVMHSATKYLGGHSDVIMGALVVKDTTLADRLYFLQNSCGAIPGPQDCFLVLRGIKTLHIRMRQHCENGGKVARFLTEHSKVEKVYWPGLESHANHNIAKEQMRDFGGMISFTLKGDKVEDAVKVMKSFKYFALAESLGGVESMVNHPAIMTHAGVPKEERLKVGLTDSLIRLSVGIEDGDDLVEDIKQALDKL
ncbi:MAG: cystathionine gamma-synthase [Candidatus Cyclobacteriaceae bacterium M2_1C_046]